MVLVSTLHRDQKVCSGEPHKPQIIIDYNASKGGVDNLDKLVSGYSCKRRTLCWPLVIFFNILDISAYNAFVIWMALNPNWNKAKLQRRRLFLQELGKELIKPHIQRRQNIPRTPGSAAIVRWIQMEGAGATGPPTPEPEVSMSKADYTLYM